MTPRQRAANRAHTLFTSLDNEGFCVYCGLPAKCNDHFLPLSVASDTLGIIDLHKGRFILPACLECNAIASNKVFPTVVAKRRYIHSRLEEKHSALLDSPEWTEEELSELKGWLHKKIRHDMAKRAQLLERLKCRKQDNPNSANIAKVRSRLGKQTSYSAGLNVSRLGISVRGQRSSGRQEERQPAIRLSKLEKEFLHFAVADYGKEMAWEMMLELRQIDKIKD